MGLRRPARRTAIASLLLLLSLVDDPVRVRQEVGPVGVLQVQERVEGPVQDGCQVRDLVQQVSGRVRQDSPGGPPARSTANSSWQEGHVTDAVVCPSVLIRR